MDSRVRRTASGVLLGLGAGTALCCAALDHGAWRAYEAVEEAWIRDRYALLIGQCAECGDAAGLELELKQAELHRRALQFQFLSKHNPRLLQGGMWQLSSIPLGENDLARLSATDTDYRRQDEKVRAMTESLRRHAGFGEFQAAQTALWKTPAYRDAHRRYTSRLRELNRVWARRERSGNF